MRSIDSGFCDSYGSRLFLYKNQLVMYGKLCKVSLDRLKLEEYYTSVVSLD